MKTVKVITTNPDWTFTTGHPEPRMCANYLYLFIETGFEKYNGYPLEITKPGKPTKETSEYAENQLEVLAKEMDVEISEIYMIGDNPASDIQGANVVGWNSILVETGVYRPDNEEHREEQRSNPLKKATHIV